MHSGGALSDSRCSHVDDSSSTPCGAARLPSSAGNLVKFHGSQKRASGRHSREEVRIVFDRGTSVEGADRSLPGVGRPTLARLLPGRHASPPQTSLSPAYTGASRDSPGAHASPAARTHHTQRGYAPLSAPHLHLNKGAQTPIVALCCPIPSLPSSHIPPHTATLPASSRRLPPTAPQPPRDMPRPLGPLDVLSSQAFAPPTDHQKG